MNISSLYSTEIREHLHPYFANWEPSNPVALGDYGFLENNVFRQVGNLQRLGVAFTVRTEEGFSRKSFQSKNGVEFKLYPKGNIETLGSATLEIDFNKENSVFFNASGCISEFIDDKDVLGEQIMKLYVNKKWKIEFVIITERIKSANTIVAISGSSNSKIKFVATNSDVNNINLSDANIELGVGFQKDIGYCIEAEKGLIPLIAFSKIKSRFLGISKDFRPIGMHSDDLSNFIFDTV